MVGLAGGATGTVGDVPRRKDSSEHGDLASPVKVFDGAFDGKHQGASGKVSPPSIWSAESYRGGSTVSSWAAAMADVAWLT